MRPTIRQGFAALAAGIVLLATASFGAEEPKPAPVPPELPAPVLVLTGLEYYEAGGKEWTRYKYHVANANAFPDEFFAPSPDRPPCGKNTNAARTWVDFYDEAGTRLYGFCALKDHSSLRQLWFAAAVDAAPPPQVFIELTDRLTGAMYQSNLAPTNRDPRLK